MNALIEKLTPKLLFSFLIFAILLLAFISFYTIQQDGDVEIGAWYFNLTTSEQKDIEIAQLKNQIEELKQNPSKEMLLSCEANLERRIPTDVVAAALGEKINIAEITKRIGTLKSCETKHAEYSKNFYFKLFILEREIRDHGNSITTTMKSDDRRDIYTLIQRILHEIGYHNGQIDGEQTSTYNAVIAFQNAYNEINSDAKLQEMGFLGYRTLEAIRSWYRIRITPTVRASNQNRSTTYHRDS